MTQAYPQPTETVVLVHINQTAADTISDTEALEEFRNLAISAGATVKAVLTSSARSPQAKFFLGTGKAEELRELVSTQQASLILFNHTLSPSQERNLERLCECRVLDRTSLILDIFAQRAQTSAGKLQVELAQLKHLSTRLIRGWTHLERQKGGIGLRGPGETQLETDRRLLRQRLKYLRKRLDKLHQQRQQSRQSRRRTAISTVSLVGYTNAGKSTLFNQLTGADVHAADQLFATLDPTLRRLELPKLGPVVLSDTVGFIRELPHDLIESFAATLEETCNANLLLHVVDAVVEDRADTVKQVKDVLEDIGADTVPQLMIYNKIDANPELSPKLQRNAEGVIIAVWLSAKTGAGLNLLQEALTERLYEDPVHCELILSPEQAKIRAKLYELNSVKQETIDDNGYYHLALVLSHIHWARLLHQYPELLDGTDNKTSASSQKF